MSDDLDPYLHWLGIRDPERPPNHYRLLGIELFESDPDVISSAADMRMAHVRNFQTGPHAKLSQRILNELAAARIGLLSATLKASYDQILRDKIAGVYQPPPPLTPAPNQSSAMPGPAQPPEFPNASQPTDSYASCEIERPARSRFREWAMGVGLTVLIGGGLAVGLYALRPNEGEGRQFYGVDDRARTKDSILTSASPPIVIESSSASKPPPEVDSPAEESSNTSQPTEQAALSDPLPRAGAPTLEVKAPSDVPPPPIMDENFAAIVQGLAGARAALEERNLAESGRILAALDGASIPTQFKAEAVRLRTINDRLITFWNAVGAGTQGLTADQTIKPGVPPLVSYGAGQGIFVFQLADGQKHYSFDKLPAEHAVALAERAFAQKHLSPLVHVATFLAFDAGADKRAARSYWDSAARNGVYVELESLLPEIGIEGVGPFPIVEFPDDVARQTDTAPPTATNQTPPATTARRVAIPNFKLRAEAKKKVADLFSGELSNAKSAAEKSALARQLAKRAMETLDDTAMAYALFEYARGLAIDAGEPALTVQLIDAMAQRFEFDLLAVKLEGFANASRVPRGSQHAQDVVKHGRSIAEQAAKAENFDAAQQAARLAVTAARTTKDQEAIRSLTAWEQELRERGGQYAQATKAAARLAENPDDEAANLVLGRYECFFRENWGRGLPLLVKSGDSAFVAAARQDISRPTLPAEQVKAGELWWNVARSLPAQSSRLMHAAICNRAKHWYTTAVHGLSGLEKLTIEKQLATIDSALSGQQSPTQDVTVRVKTLNISISPGVSIPFRLIPAGTFEMGDAGNRHKVVISQPFYLSTTEITQAQWVAVMSTNPSQRQASAQLPVENVTWNDCQQFVERLQRLPAGQNYRFGLPSEAQWEYACRAGSTAMFPFGDDPKVLSEYAWCSENSGGTSHPVGELKSNGWGLHDMLGNVSEWCADWIGPPVTQAQTDPTGPTMGTNRAYRGGNWNSSAPQCESATRAGTVPNNRNPALGLRVVLQQGR